VLVSGNEVADLTCAICMGKIKGELEYGYCDKRSFHLACLQRLNGCPYCKLKYAVRGRESTTTREGPIPSWAAHAREEPQTTEEDSPCPACGEHVVQDTAGCPACGAVYVAPGEIFCCPVCSSPVMEGDNAECPNCGEHFLLFRPRSCPACGRTVRPNEQKCQCGALLDDRCPECGSPLSETDSTCPNCGAAFEFI
jgi:hypothetical protein